jgi:soluble lytic murein transglycosylase-like protein
VTKLPSALALATLASLSLPVRAGTFWSRERPDGVIEFTNIPREGKQKGKQWKVWLKAGPSGKAAALRGATDPVPPRDRSDARLSRFDQDIRDGQATFGVPEAFLRAVIKTESDFDPRVVSSAGAQGLMQLLPETARLMGVTDPFDPRQNIMGGARYLQVLARRFCRTPSAAPATALAPATVCSPEEKVKIVAAYHAGPGAVEKYGGIPPYETTRAYVAMVMRRYAQYRQGVGESAAGAGTSSGSSVVSGER